ncbi:MAG: hypothetical protein ACOXZS_04085 [Bacilli bacterium]|jgi:tRNA nucleotidyltransferase (CCA-adding enzyme)
MLEVITEILNEIIDNGYQAYVVGGFVRDYYLGKISDDIDICTNAKIDDIRNIFDNIISVDDNYGAIAIEYKGIYCEITTFRKDVIYRNNRKPIVEYVDTLAEDLIRRDFTINTLCMDKDLNIIDLFNAKTDIDNKIIRSVGNPFDKINEDILRILRAIRLATILIFNIDKQLKDAIIKHKHLLKNLSYERKREELDKIFSSDNVKYGIKLILSLKLDDVLELSNLNKVKITTNPLGIWAQLDANSNYFNKRERKIIDDVKKLLILDHIDNYTLYQYDLVAIEIVSEINDRDLKKQYESLPIKHKKDIVIKFNDIKAILSIDDKIKIRNILDDIEKLIVLGKLTNDIDVIKQYILNKYSGR